jgi:hypothetical protein
MPGSDIRQKPLVGHVTPDITNILTLPLIFNAPLKFLSVLHQNNPILFFLT